MYFAFSTYMFCTEMLHMTIAHEIINRTLSQILTAQDIKKIRKLEMLRSSPLYQVTILDKKKITWISH